MLIKIAFVVIVGILTLGLLARNTNRWARSLQQYYIGEANKLYGNSAGWDRPWRLFLFKALVIFFGLMAILGAYVVIFSH
jgi:hypothetical protein